MNICYCSSNGYWKCLAVSVYSLFLNNKNVEKLNLYILSDGIEKSSKEKIANIASDFKRNVIWIDAENELKEFSQKFNLEIVRGTFSTYARLILPSILKTLDKVLFIDSDTIILNDLSTIYNSDLDGKAMGMVPEVMVYIKNNTFEDPKIVNSVKTYFNAGIVLYDFLEWRKKDLSERLLDSLKSSKRIELSNDQSILNYYLNGEIAKINLSANFYTPLHGIDYKVFLKYFSRCESISKTEFDLAKKSPAIVHFYGMPYDRPWFRMSISPYKKMYRSLMRSALGKDYKLQRWPKTNSFFFRVYDRITFAFKATSFPCFYRWFHYRFSQKIKEVTHKDRKKIK
jgi:lipopolysaccharide biosynthesis glycosyltransferase